MNDHVFIGWPLAEAQLEAESRDIQIQAVLETKSPKNNGGQGSLYVIQERWVDEHTVILVAGLRLISEQERTDSR